MEETLVKVEFSDRADAEAVLIHWVYDEGALVRSHEIIAEAMVDKVSLSIEAPVEGYLHPLLKENDTFSSGQAIAKITQTQIPRTQDSPHRESRDNGANNHAPSEDEFVPAPPRVRRYAREKGINLKELAQAISHRPLTVEDIDNWIQQHGSTPVQPYSPFRQRLIHNLTDKNALPTTLSRRIAAGDSQFSPLVRICWAADQALKRHPEIHGWANAEGFTPATELRLGVATSTAQGLIVPIFVGSRDLDGWNQALAELRRAAHDNHWEHWDFSQPSFVISNLGPWGIEYFTPRLMVPTVAILGLGAGDDKSFPVSLTFDHRAVDGVQAANFLQTMDKLLRSQRQGYWEQ
ncbi:2-oxo acid dehydrogenase subunit E2 [Sulfobacillus thermosulfidooxidans]|uniref:2-oxo acid dehydrogenase subunit E2 n=1 Tax=Sulfobacillus thermosulfidooxidans TaxID=28034 RepID=UPI000B1DA75F|nr:2-oxo acid dehydrogenase subunit E2 [Sulfobacillus thermosulfidooxidans]